MRGACAAHLELVDGVAGRLDQSCELVRHVVVLGAAHRATGSHRVSKHLLKGNGVI